MPCLAEHHSALRITLAIAASKARQAQARFYHVNAAGSLAPCRRATGPRHIFVITHLSRIELRDFSVRLAFHASMGCVLARVIDRSIDASSINYMTCAHV